MDRLKSTAQPERLAYASDLTDYEWTQIETWLSQPAGPGRKRTVNLREIFATVQKICSPSAGSWVGQAVIGN